jgi:hypothetical protein
MSYTLRPELLGSRPDFHPVPPPTPGLEGGNGEPACFKVEGQRNPLTGLTQGPQPSQPGLATLRLEGSQKRLYLGQGRAPVHIEAEELSALWAWFEIPVVIIITAASAFPSVKGVLWC